MCALGLLLLAFKSEHLFSFFFIGITEAIVILVCFLFSTWRSPWSNKYHPPLDDGPYPSAELRKLEIEANDVFAIYRDQWGPLLTSYFL